MVSERDKKYNQCPKCVSDLPKALQQYVKDSRVTEEELNSNFELVLDVLRLTVKKEEVRERRARLCVVTAHSDTIPSSKWAMA